MGSYSALLFRFIILTVVILLIDFYVFKGIKAATQGISDQRAKIIFWVYWGLNIAMMIAWILGLAKFSTHKGPGSVLFQTIFGILILFFVPKLIFSLFLLTEDVYRLIRAIVVLLKNNVFSDSEPWQYFESRRKFVSQVGLAIASIPFLGILHGITFGKYKYTIHRVNLKFKDLPDAFDGYTITQISDIHSGSFDDATRVEKGVALINSLNSDLILFTGDIVNTTSDEMDEWKETFKKIKSSHGVYSVFGNHDYGDYTQWNSPEEKHQDHEKLKSIHKEIGFRLMLNENVKIEKDGQHISLIGIENWGLPPFPQYGDLNKALNGVEENAFKILMSHDPSHWDAQVLKHSTHIHLTLAGHTHGFQFGIEIPGIKWSPVQYRYPRWAGLYEKAEKYLYVNRGFGFIGFPGRVGIWPEITYITLNKA